MPSDEAQPGDDLLRRNLLDLLEPMRATLSQAPEAKRYRLLAFLLEHFADLTTNTGNGRNEAVEQAKALGRRVQDLQRDNADVQDRLRTTQADLSRREKQLKAEEDRGRELEATLEDRRQRLSEMQKEMEELQAQLEARNHDVYQFQNERDDLKLRVQRAELKAGDRTLVDSIEEGRRGLTGQVEELQVRMDQLRADKEAELKAKEAEISQLRIRLSEQATSASQGTDHLLATLRDDLANLRDDLPLAKAAALPSHQPTGEPSDNLVLSFVLLTLFAQGLEQDMAVFVDRYTRPHPTLGRQWQAYTKQDGLKQVIQQTVAPQNPRPVGAFRMRLPNFYRFLYSAMMGSDAAFEFIASELRDDLLGEFGAGNDPNTKIKDYLRNDGHERFMDRMKKLRSEKMAEVFIRG